MPDEAARLNQLSEQIIGAAIEVHRGVGPGLLESAYERCLYYELVTCRGLAVERQKRLPLVYKGVTLNCAYRMDLVVEASVVVEVKAIARFESVHDAQMDHYLKMTDLRLGLMFNFHVWALKAGGIRRRVNRFPE
jgi:GxxExxY protein